HEAFRTTLGWGHCRHAGSEGSMFGEAAGAQIFSESGGAQVLGQPEQDPGAEHSAHLGPHWNERGCNLADRP
ncbi:hypothetical protein CRG98_045996, partial [Punica granatum]